MILPRLYVICDVETLLRRGLRVREFCVELARAGVKLVQLRDKVGTPAEVLERARIMRDCLPEAWLVMNDRADLAALAGFDGVHVGQGDLGVGSALLVLRARATREECEEGEAAKNAKRFVGVSTHVAADVQEADGGQAGYVAMGPVFGTVTKPDAAAVVGLEGVRLARTLTGKPLVGIGGITLKNCRSVVEAGADCVAVISGVFVEGRSVERVCGEFSRVLGKS